MNLEHKIKEVSNRSSKNFIANAVQEFLKGKKTEEEKTNRKKGKGFEKKAKKEAKKERKFEKTNKENLSEAEEKEFEKVKKNSSKKAVQNLKENSEIKENNEEIDDKEIDNKKRGNEDNEGNEHLGQTSEIKESDKKTDDEETDDEKTDDEETADEEIGDEDDNDNDNVSINVKYSHEKQFLMEQFYGAKALDYIKLFYGNEKVRAAYEEEGEEYNSSFRLKVNTETMTDEEAGETLKEMQLAAVLGTTTEISIEKRKRFANWVTFNKTLMNLYHSLYAMTGDVDYSKIF